MSKPVEEVVILKLPKQANAKVKQAAEESKGNGVKRRVKSIGRVFSRISSTPSATFALPKQELVDAKRHLYLTPRSGSGTANRNRVQVFSLESADGVVITSTRSVDDKTFSQAQVQPADGVVTPDRKANELRVQDDMVGNSTPLTILSHEDNEYCDALHRSQLRKDALLLASAKQAVRPPRAKGSDSRRNISSPSTFILDVDKNTVSNKEPDLFEQEDVGASICGAFDACSMRLCFERDEDKFIVVIPHGFCVDANDDVSSISGGLNELY